LSPPSGPGRLALSVTEPADQAWQLSCSGGKPEQLPSGDGRPEERRPPHVPTAAHRCERRTATVHANQAPEARSEVRSQESGVRSQRRNPGRGLAQSQVAKTLAASCLLTPDP